MTETNEGFRTLAQAALRCGCEMLAALSPQAVEQVLHATQSGARLLMEFGPLPSFDGVALILVEREGRRHEVGRISVRNGPLQ